MQRLLLTASTVKAHIHETVTHAQISDIHARNVKKKNHFPIVRNQTTMDTLTYGQNILLHLKSQKKIQSNEAANRH